MKWPQELCNELSSKGSSLLFREGSCCAQWPTARLAWSFGDRLGADLGGWIGFVQSGSPGLHGSRQKASQRASVDMSHMDANACHRRCPCDETGLSYAGSEACETFKNRGLQALRLATLKL